MCGAEQREFFIDNLQVRIHFIIVMIRWTGLAPWEFEFPVPVVHVRLHQQLLDLQVRGGLVFKASRLLYHSTLGSRAIKKKKKVRGVPRN